jgi:hypothetical protein
VFFLQDRKIPETSMLKVFTNHRGFFKKLTGSAPKKENTVIHSQKGINQPGDPVTPAIKSSNEAVAFHGHACPGPAPG